MTTPGAPRPTAATEPVPAQAILAPDPHPLTPWQRWQRFWFPRADPTTLAFIRICTGLLVFYIHLAYSLDLQHIFGKHGWYAQEIINRERKEGPVYMQPFAAKWDEVFSFAQLSDFPHRRRAFLEFLRGLPEDKAQREMVLRYLNRAHNLKNLEEFRRAIAFVENMQTKEKFDNGVKVLEGRPILNAAGKEVTEFKSNAQQIVPFFMELPVEERLAVAAEVGAFWNALAAVPGPTDEGRKYVLNYFYELSKVNPYMLRSLIEYLNTLPEDAKARKDLIDYMDYWNSDPRKAYKQGNGIFSFWFHVSDPAAMALIHTIVLVLIFMFAIGLFTRVTSVMVWVATVGYIHRTQQVLFGMDTMMNILLIYLMIGNSGAALSVDRLIARYRAVRASLRRSGAIDANTRAFLACPPPSANAGFALRLIQVHFCFIYMAAGLSKLKGPAWWDGRAFWDVITNPEFTLMPYPLYEQTMHWMSAYLPVYYTTTILACWLTLFVEIATPFLLWTRLRWFIILLATAMHAVIAVMMGLNLFELLMIVMLVAFFPDRCIRDRFRGGAGLVRLAFTFNPQNQKHAAAAALAVAVDVDNQIALEADQSAAAVAVSPGPPPGDPGILASFFRNLRLLSPLGFLLWLPGVRALLTGRLFPNGESAASGLPLKPPATTAAR